MAARLKYVKVIDREHFYIKGGRLHPGLESGVVVNEEPGIAAAFLVMRAWSEDTGTFTEQWRIETPGGSSIYESTPRELHIANHGHVERLEDEVADMEVEYTSDDYSIVFQLDDQEVSRTRFSVRPTRPETE
jgi:hypothetical protein